MIQFYNITLTFLKTFNYYLDPLVDVGAVANVFTAGTTFVVTLDSHPVGAATLLSIIATICYTIIARRK
jgi:ABC-type glycerol-3-phosphate transport system permease component